MSGREYGTGTPPGTTEGKSASKVTPYDNCTCAGGGGEAPVGPVGPIEPDVPVGPVIPGGPVGPVNPGRPLGPIQHSASQHRAGDGERQHRLLLLGIRYYDLFCFFSFI